MKLVLPDFKKAKILVVGDIMLDRYWYGFTNRISVEAPVPIVNIKKKEDRPGGAANVAMNISSLGSIVRLIGYTGIDNASSILIKKLEENNVLCDFIQLSTHPTITKLRILSHNQQLIRIDLEEKFDIINSSLLYSRIKKFLDVDVIVLSDYNKGTLSNISDIIKLANKKNIPILVDPKSNNFNSYYGSTLITPNLSEFEKIVGKCVNNLDIESKGLKLLKKLNLKGLLITRSEEGMTLLEKDKKPVHFPTKAKEVYDVTGGGDTVIAVLASVLAVKFDFYYACILANLAAGLVVGKLGTSTVSIKEFEKALNLHLNNKFGIINLVSLKKEVESARKRGEKIVMTNGCFDILHSGHVKYLANAKKLGDRLIVSVNSDESIKRLKGNDRPINSLMQRMIVLKSLSFVDWVIAFDEDTPKDLIVEILPDILVKGGDYKLEDIAGSKEIVRAGRKVKIINLEDSISTTKIINSVIDNKK
ncbi:MAG: bifunctional D-glycero-beta-D-manno-heptose-7-phosphate kinase/D-glycero-beta-D-manno-heptose 1-phosphate adenylyltransferase HldE [Arsenophonus sp.]|nr:MAG: bifunctional D-glycero-beta-D-manno-heptose-7-phosphate kinase/D-glycero-beta-D-manno-heptose 1-phosphate adenylyltransferase HldE [Arsenophonus sp.]